MSVLADKPVAAVVWEDAHGRLTDDFTEEEIEREFHNPAIYTTFGLLIRDDEKGVTLASDVTEDGQFRGLNFVPRGMIRETVVLGVPKRKRIRKAKSVPITTEAESAGD